MDTTFETYQKIKLEKLPEVEKRTSLKKSSIYAKVGRGEFPKPVRLGKRTVAWVSDEVTKWIEEHIEKSRRQPA